MKKCVTCRLSKPLSGYHKQASANDGYQPKCKECRKVISKEYYTKNSETIKERVETYQRNNSEPISNYQAQYRKDNKEKIRKSQKIYRDNNLEKAKQYYKDNREILNTKRRIYIKKKFKESPLAKLSHNISTLIRLSITGKGFTKKSKTVDILGCSNKEFKIYLESNFESWMNWDNRGLYNGELNYGWDIDHIIPLDVAVTEEDVIRLNHYTNLQPLCGKVNRDIKRNFWKSGLKNRTS